MMRLRPTILLAIVAAVALGAPARGQDWPTRPVTLINPFTAGTDALLRSIAAVLSEQFGQPFIVENKPGGGGAVGAAFVAKAAPDGYTFLSTATGPAVLNKLVYKSIPYDPDADFEPVILQSEAPQVIVSTPALGFTRLQDLIDYGRKNPGKLNIGHAGAGTTGHLAAAVLLSRAGITGSLVGYRGAAPAIQDVLGGQIQAAFPIYVGAVNSVTRLAVTSAERVPFLPDVPTVRESGIDLVATTWIGLVAPKGTPNAIIGKLNAAIDAYLKSPEGRGRMNALGHVPLGGPPERLTALMAAEKARWAPVIAAEKISLDAN
jgi:tripartite-type tricarboxylate transporter receptor subunit TctC